MANRYFQDNNPNKGEGGNGKKESIKSSAKGEPKEPKFAANCENSVKEGMGFGNKASTKQKIGEAKHS